MRHDACDRPKTITDCHMARTRISELKICQRQRAVCSVRNRVFIKPPLEAEWLRPIRGDAEGGTVSFERDHVVGLCRDDRGSLDILRHIESGGINLLRIYRSTVEEHPLSSPKP